jgi:amidase
VEGDLTGVRVALSVDLARMFEVDHAVSSVVKEQVVVFEGAGASVEDAAPVLHGADAAFRTLRAWLFQYRFRSLLEKRPEAFKPSLRDNIEAGADLSGFDVAQAYQRLTSIQDRMRVFFESYDVLALPVSQVPPFSAEEEFPQEINGQRQATYLDWMRSAYVITVTGCPAISLPAGFTSEGWPVGLQLVTAPRQERRLLEIAHAFEQATRVGDRRPALPSEDA